MPACDRALPWFHGTPLDLTVLRSGSSVTQNRGLARVFSFKPTVVSISDGGEIMHNGQRSGILYRLAGPIADKDMVPHARSAMPAGLEWVTTRELFIEMVTRTEVRPDELLTDQDIARLVGSAPKLSPPDDG